MSDSSAEAVLKVAAGVAYVGWLMACADALYWVLWKVTPATYGFAKDGFTPWIPFAAPIALFAASLVLLLVALVMESHSASVANPSQPRSGSPGAAFLAHKGLTVTLDVAGIVVGILGLTQ